MLAQEPQEHVYCGITVGIVIFLFSYRLGQNIIQIKE